MASSCGCVGSLRTLGVAFKIEHLPGKCESLHLLFKVKITSGRHEILTKPIHENIPLWKVIWSLNITFLTVTVVTSRTRNHFVEVCYE